MLACLALCAACGGGDAAVDAWAIGVGGTGQDSVAAAAVGPGGTVVLGGYVSATVTAGDVELTSAGAWDAAVVRTGAGGAVAWAVAFGGDGNDYVDDLVVDPADGSVVAIGTFADGFELAGETLATAGGADIWVARFSANGEPVWARRFGGSGDDFGRAVAIREDGAIAIAGDFTLTAGFGELPLQSEGESDAFVVLLDGDGEPLWARRFGGRGFDSATAVVRSDDGVAVAGTFEGSLPLDVTELTSKGALDMFVIAVDADGTTVRAASYGSPRDDFARALARSDAGAVALAGDFSGAIAFGGQEHTSADYDAVVVVLDAAGAPVWSAAVTGEGASAARAVAFDGDDLVAAGGFRGTAALGDLSVTAFGDSDLFVTRFTATGEPLWLQRFGGSSPDVANAVAVDATGAPIVAGAFEGMGNFAHAALTSAGARDMFALTLP